MMEIPVRRSPMMSLKMITLTFDGKYDPSSVTHSAELAKSLEVKLLHKRYRDSGRLYEVVSVRYDPSYDVVVGTRRNLITKQVGMSTHCVYYCN